jgi:hypothetical protein
MVLKGQEIFRTFPLEAKQGHISLFFLMILMARTNEICIALGGGKELI